ncbi:hypothetical protein CRG98_003152 [Punica granatum]|uniref:Uncharacterized protein n=1 Tax=Punica granatum TaxID=22663 RepID=A0A2I0L733_PUNGR|nr:hypothetical protein CRG98_003152 [Punica granatum]
MAPAEWIQGLPSSRLKAFGISNTWNVTLKEHGPISMRRSISPFTSLREPSKARTAVLLGRTRLRSTFICFKVVTGHTLSAEPLSIMTRPTIWLLHLQTMCSARECAHPSEGSSSSENEIVLEKVELMVSSIRSGGVPLGTCAAVRTRRRASLWGSELSRRASSEMWAGDLAICSTTLLDGALGIASTSVAGAFPLSVVAGFSYSRPERVQGTLSSEYGSRVGISMTSGAGGASIPVNLTAASAVVLALLALILDGWIEARGRAPLSRSCHEFAGKCGKVGQARPGIVCGVAVVLHHPIDPVGAGLVVSAEKS